MGVSMAVKNLLKDFKKPKSITVEHSDTNMYYGKFIAAPFEKGFGVTIANSLRRTLLSSIHGYSITAIHVDYVDQFGKHKILSSEFEQIHGMYEDTIEFIQNIKQVRLVLAPGIENRVIRIEVKGECELKAKDLIKDNQIEVVNPDLVLAKFNDDTEIYMDIQIDYGRGYTPAERNIEYVETIGSIPIDAIFSPVKKVTFGVENFRVGQRTDYDKVILEVWTDGTLKPEDAVANAAKILKEYFSQFINFEEYDEVETEEHDEDEEKLKLLLETSIEDLELSVRSSTCLRVSNIRTLGELVQKSEEEVLKVKNFSKKSLEEMKNRLAEMDLKLGMKDVSYTSKLKPSL